MLRTNSLITCFLCCTLAAADAPRFFDDFSDGDVLDGSPVYWHHAGTIESDPSTGDLVLRGRADNDVVVAIPGDEIVYGDVLAQTRVRFLDSADVRDGAVLFARAGETSGSYFAGISSRGELVAGMHDGTTDVFHYDVPSEIDVFENDVILELQAVGDQISFLAWQADTPKPNAPLVTFTDATHMAGVVGLNIDPNNGHASAVFRHVSVVPLGDILIGDFDENGALDEQDINVLAGQVRTGLNSALFDVTGDGELDHDDHRFWVEGIKKTAFGDANLDGTVGFDDFVTLSNHFNQPADWEGGDFDGNGEVTFSDFVLLSTNYGSSPSSAVGVPEPCGWMIGSLCLLAGFHVRRKRTEFNLKRFH